MFAVITWADSHTTEGFGGEYNIRQTVGLPTVPGTSVRGLSIVPDVMKKAAVTDTLAVQTFPFVGTN
jgi:hypothetical protein